MSRKARTPLLDWIRTAYAPADTVDEWTQRMTREARGLLPGAVGVVGGILDTTSPLASWRYSVDTESRAVRDLLNEHEARRPTRVDFLMGDPGPGRTKEAVEALVRAGDPYWREVSRQFSAAGIEDMFHLTAVDGEGAWVSIGFLLGRERPLADASSLWSMASVHFATAMRLQRHAWRGAPRPSLRVAFNPDAGSEAAETVADLGDDGTARDRLRAAVRAMDAASGQTPATTEEDALSIWQGLVDGTWSLVDEHDADGRRYVVATKNPVSVRDARGLSEREAAVAAFIAEGYSEKWVAYTLGISRTTVANHLRSALAKLGQPSAVALARAFHMLDTQETK